MKSTVGMVLKYSILDNWLLSSNTTFSKVVQLVAVQYPRSVRSLERISTGGWTDWVCPVPRKNSWQSSPRWRHRGRCCQTSSSRNEANAKTSETFLCLCPSLDSQVPYFLGDLWGTLPILFFDETSQEGLCHFKIIIYSLSSKVLSYVLSLWLGHLWGGGRKRGERSAGYGFNTIVLQR